MVLFPKSRSALKKRKSLQSESIQLWSWKHFLKTDMCSLVAIQWLYKLALAMLKFHLCKSSSSKLWGRALATSERKITMHRFKLFFRAPPLPPRCTASMVAAAKTRVQQLPPRIAAYPLSPLSLPAADLLSRAQIKCGRKILPRASR